MAHRRDGSEDGMSVNAGDDPRITVDEAMARLRLMCAGGKWSDVLPPPTVEDLWTGKPMVVPDRPPPMVEHEGHDIGVRLAVAVVFFAVGAVALSLLWIVFAYMVSQ